MAIQLSPTKLERPVQSRQSTQFNLPRVDESYFDRLAVFGLACLAAAIVGKLTMAALTPQYKKDIRRTV
jgi:hypothetical protein